jgi:ABC-2 type transport system ATP-binding protein
MNGITVSKLCKSYSNCLVVDQVSFTAKSGSITGFLGPNGAGKTTTIRMIMGITAPDSGSIQFGNSESSAIPRSRIGYLPEERGLYKEARVMNILQFLAELKGIDRSEAIARANIWLQKFDLVSKAHKKVEELSKGMAQKIQFIATVLHEPEYVILDEPFSGLDPVSQDIFKAELRALADAGATILLSSHQMNILEELCDEIFLINNGKELFQGSLSQLQDKYGNFVLKLKLEQEEQAQMIADLPIVSSIKQLAKNKLELILKDGIDPRQLLLDLPKDLGFTELNLAKTGLHEIFVKIAREAGNEK